MIAASLLKKEEAVKQIHGEQGSDFWQAYTIKPDSDIIKLLYNARGLDNTINYNGDDERMFDIEPVLDSLKNMESLCMSFGNCITYQTYYTRTGDMFLCNEYEY